MGLLDSKDAIVRNRAYDAINQILEKYKDVAEKEMNSILETKRNIDALRNYERPDAARHLGDDIAS